MKKISVLLCIISLVLSTFSVSCSNEELNDTTNEQGTSEEQGSEEQDNTNDPTDDESENDTTITEEILQLVNEYRRSKNLSELTINTTATELAIDHTLYMISQQSISHDNFSSRSDILNQQENARSTAENVASFYPDAESVVNAWIESDGHRENIEGNYSYIGIAAIRDENGRYYFTQLFYR